MEQVITSDLAGEQAESAESDVGRAPSNGQVKVREAASHTHSIESHSRAGAQILSALDSHAISNPSPKTELGVALDRQVGPLTGPANMSFDFAQWEFSVRALPGLVHHTLHRQVNPF